MSSPALGQATRSRGMRDLLPDEMRAFRRVEDAFRVAATRWGYEEVRTPTIETYSLFTSAGSLTPEMLSRVYTFLDWDGWSGERVVLRPDSTIPVVRLASQGGIEPPARLFYVQNVFRFHESEDDREEWQCGIEYLGAPDRLGELEVASIACETLMALGLDPVIRLSHVGVAHALIRSLNGAVSGDLHEEVVREGPEVLRRFATDAPAVGAFLDIAANEGGVALLDNLAAFGAASLPETLQPIAELRNMAAALEESGRKVVIDLRLKRGFEYYRGLVFEFIARGRMWGGGGRYTAAGIASACGLELEAEALAKLLAPASRRRDPVSVVPTSDEDLGRALQVTRALHRSGISAALSGSKLAPVTVSVSGEVMRATISGQTHELSRLDDLVGLLVQAK